MTIQRTVVRFCCILISLVLISFSLSCGRIGGGFESGSIKGNDFKKSEILTNSPQEANGNSELLVVVSLKNSDSTPIVDFRPEYSITMGQGIIGNNCTTSNSDGTATCILKSTIPGVRKFSIRNIDTVDLTKSIEFTTPISRSPVLGFAGSTKGDGVLTTGSGYSVMSSIGSASKIYQTTPSNYQVFSQIQGVVLDE